ncbi:MAG: UxaA family hydrolase [Armatimonadota bacterium]|nr:UxaA family hydrolase [Armatimonadota bacterium]MDR7432513.1 UxaA family hydrolase [Armatimonadota bacterium]MDR7514448.1 UxaA family hydrolase [Armatimonadota bacterium]MDR7602925.1 UxaA family hydrolase [Armatimonadota bacterium]
MSAIVSRRVRAVRLHPDDDVAVVLEPARAGDVVGLESGTVVLRDAVPRFHKVALRDLPEGSPVRKLGEVIGLAVRPIRTGEHVHVHNLRSARSTGR